MDKEAERLGGLKPDEKVSVEEMKELKALKREALLGECVPVEEVASAFWVSFIG